jgi:hypothetical protein
MTAQAMVRDERTVMVENSSYRWGYLLLSYGLLVSTAYRAFVLEQQSWDLLGLVVLGGAVTTLYQGRGRVLTGRWALLSGAGAVLALVLAAALVVLMR